MSKTAKDRNPWPVSVTGSNVADGAPISGMSFVEDPEGYFALRVVDAAPFAYDDVNERLLVTNEPVEEVVLYDQSISTSVGATAAAIIDLTPGAGYIGEVVRAGYYAPAPSGAASGSHLVRFLMGGATLGAFEFEKLQEVTAAFGAAVSYPVSTVSATKLSLEGVVFSESVPLRVRYSNNTDVAQTGARRLIVLYKRRKVQSA